MNVSTPPKVLTIAGSDSGGGAGIQADLKTIAVHGCYGLSVITAITAQNTQAVTGVMDVTPELIRLQLEAVVSDIGCQAAKTGMLSRIETIVAVSDFLRGFPLANLVVDPVMVSKSGDRLLSPDAIEAMRRLVFPFARLITPNLPEVEELIGFLPESVKEMERAAEQLARLTPGAVLIKGGHLAGDQAIDVLWDGQEISHLSSPRLSATHTHGTGCTLSAAIACHLAGGCSVREAVSNAREYLLAAIQSAYPVGKGVGPVNHLWPYGQPTSFRTIAKEDCSHG